MIHDIILSLLSEKESIVIKELTNLELATNFLHPAEVDTLKNINRITSKYREIRKFISLYKTCCNENTKMLLSLAENKCLPPGLYLQAFTNGLEKAIDSYRQSVTALEKQYLRESGFGLMFILHEVEKFRPLFEFLMRMISCVTTQNIHGCQFLQFLQDNSLHGDRSITRAVNVIQKSVYTVFIQQLCQWLKYGKFVDMYGEFIIASVEPSEPMSNNPSTSVPSFQSSDTSSDLVDIWNYEINYNMLPIYFSKNWAEKVFFIGQTVLMFNSDVNNNTNNDGEDQRKSEKQTIWDEQDHGYFGKFSELQEADHFSAFSFEKIVDEIKQYVTERLSLILVKDADLVKHLRLLRDFYLLGRGELFCELIKALNQFHTNCFTENTLRELNRVLNKTAASVNIPDVLDLFSFDMCKDENEESFVANQKPILNVLSLKYNVQWPLHLLFSPKVLENYNDLFRFMMKIKKIQQDLYAVWHHHRQEKNQRNNKLFEFRNNLMFFIDNLQYYLQVEVVESQYSIMMKKIEERTDFEQIQKAHNCFLANILSLCFMLESAEYSMILSRTMGLSSESQVFKIINKILQLIENFTSFAFICSNPLNEEDEKTFDNFDKLFASFIESLMNKLRNLQGSAPVAQLLLRLDFNFWFSSQIDCLDET